LSLVGMNSQNNHLNSCLLTAPPSLRYYSPIIPTKNELWSFFFFC
jgi:hypothetical protein